MKLNRLLAIATTLALGATLFTATSATAIPPATYTSGDYTYTLNGGNATITYYTGTNMAITIPAAFSDGGTNYPVTAIGEYAFAENALTSVTIGSSVTTIGAGAFTSNQLTSVAIGSSVTSIGHQAFYGNQLPAVAIPNSVTSIGEYAFAGNSLTSVTIPNSVSSIGAGAFEGNLLTSVTIGISVTSIGETAFDSNASLESALFLGNAPAIVDPAWSAQSASSSRSFDTSSGNFKVSFTFGNTTFGDGPTWEGYTLLQPTEPGVASTSDITAGVTAGVRSVNLGPAAFTSVSYSHAVQTVNTTATLSVNDLTGAGVGWNVTLSSSALTWTARSGGPSTGTNLPATALALTTVGSVTTAAGNAWGGSSATGALGSPVKVLTTSGGNGSYTTPLTLTLTVPGQASVGTYAGTLTTTISAAP